MVISGCAQLYWTAKGQVWRLREDGHGSNATDVGL